MTDLETAFKWYSRAAEKGDPAAIMSVGGFHFEGIGREKDVAKGMAMVRSAAMLGLVDAAINLGAAYRDGNGVERDEVESLMWFIVAVERKHPGDERIPIDLASARDALKERLNEEQRKTAQEGADAILSQLRYKFKSG